MTDPTPQSTEPTRPGLLDVPEDASPRTVLGVDEPTTEIELATLGKIGPAMLVVTLAVALAYLVPGLEFARPWQPGDPVPFWNVLGRAADEAREEADRERLEGVEEIAEQALAEPDPVVVPRPEIELVPEADVLPPYEAHPDDAERVEQSLQLFRGDELDGFFGALARTDASFDGAITHVVHWGDSAIGVDGIPGAIRKRLQARFGDAGHGFHLMQAPNTSYRHDGVKFRGNGRWGKCFIIYRCAEDGHYGLGGTTFRSVGGAESWFAPNPKHSTGVVSRFKLWYAAHPEGGQIRARIDDREQVLIDTRSDVLEDRWHGIDVPEGAHELSVRAAGEGRVRVYGVTLERDVPGITWDGLALVGAFAKRMLEFDREHLAAQLEEREAHLAVFMFGGNDMGRKIKMSSYVDEYRQVLRLVLDARPGMGCIVMAPLDHGRRDGQLITSLPIVPKMVEAQRKAAKAEGCAFFDTYAAMGGKGSAARWFNRKPRLISGDLGHVTAAGRRVIGEMFYRALMEAYVAYRARTDGRTP